LNVELFWNVAPLKFIGPMLVKELELVKVPLLMLIVPLLLHDVGLMLVTPVPVCLVIVPVLVKVELVLRTSSPFIVSVPLFTIAPEPTIEPPFQTMVLLLVRAAFSALVPVVFSVRVCPAEIVSARPNVPFNQVLFPLMVKVPVPPIFPWIVKSLLIVRFPAPLIVLILLKTKEAGNTWLMFSVSVLELLKLPVPDSWEPVL